jgi:hypothetical protein
MKRENRYERTEFKNSAGCTQNEHQVWQINLHYLIFNISTRSSVSTGSDIIGRQ